MSDKARDYEDLPAGRASDLLVAPLLGWYWGPVRSEAWREAYPQFVDAKWELAAPGGNPTQLLNREPSPEELFTLPNFTTNLVHAWPLYDRLRDAGWTIQIGSNLADGSWAMCSKDLPDGGQAYFEAHAERDEEALALCRLSLLAEEPPPPPAREPDKTAVEKLSAEIREGLTAEHYYVVPVPTFCEALNVPAANAFSVEDRAIRFAEEYGFLLQRFDIKAGVIEFKRKGGFSVASDS